jgi:hypothetical protein
MAESENQLFIGLNKRNSNAEMNLKLDRLVLLRSMNTFQLKRRKVTQFCNSFCAGIVIIDELLFVSN